MERYTRTAMVLHWLIALAIVAQIGFGWYLQQIPRRTPDRTIYVNYHKSTGMLIGLLILARIAWRLKHKPPPLPASMPAWERRAARANHVLLYACMITMPVAGYTASNFSKFGVNFFNVVLLPPWGVDDRSVYAFFNGLHVWNERRSRFECHTEQHALYWAWLNGDEASTNVLIISCFALEE